MSTDEQRIAMAELEGWIYPGSTCLKHESWNRWIRALREESAEDKPIPEDAAIEAAHPVNSGSHDTYGEAMRLVGAKHSKAALVALVNWLLMERDELRAENERLRQQLNSANQQHQLKAI